MYAPMRRTDVLSATALAAVLCTSGCNESTESEGADGSTESLLVGAPVLPSEPGDIPAGEPGPAIAAPGERLLPIMIEADDATQFVTWYDSMLEIECSFRPTAEGERCLPLDAGIVSDGESCTEPFSSVAPGRLTFLTRTVGSNCDVTVDVFTFVEGAKDQTPQCTHGGGDALGPTALWPVEPVDLSTFVLGTRTTTTSEGYGDDRRDTEDGAWRIIGATYDGFKCDARAFGGETFCLTPYDFHGTCSGQPVACEPVPHGLRYDGTGTEIASVYQVDEGRNATNCGWEEGLVFTPLGDLQPSGLPTSRPGLFGSGRIRVPAQTDDQDVARWPEHDLPAGIPVQLFDTRFGVICTPEKTEAGVLRCMPAEGVRSSSSQYADSDCMVHVYPGAVDTSTMEPQELTEWSEDELTDPIFARVLHENEWELHGLVAYDGPIYEKKDGCRTTDRLLSKRYFLPTGGPIPDSAFEEVTRTR